MASATDSPFLVARARPEEFERVYDCVDAAFGKKRPRAVYDWLYRKNPNGLARCWVVWERATGQLLKTGAGFPWPIWHGDDALFGSFGGDAATRPDWQRKGLSDVRRTIRRTHPWWQDFCSISGPNAASRAVAQNARRTATLLGPLRGGLLLLRASDVLMASGLPGALARPAGFVANGASAAWRRLVFRPAADESSSNKRIEQVQRFTVDYDEITRRCMATPDFWCPHNSEFLNWRYLEHPDESYIALTLIENERPIGYAVVLLDGGKATLSEFAVAKAPRQDATHLLESAINVAREAGCRHLNFFATPRWRHWRLFHRAGFIPYPSPNHFEASCKAFEPEVLDQRKWQVMPGDRDYH